MAEILAPIRAAAAPDLLVGFETSDDAAVYRLDGERAMVCTADFITPVVDDPRTFGRIAAANSLSDVYAMGGVPLVALNLLGYPPAGVPNAVLGEILVGAGEVCAAAGCAVGGGHSVRDDEVKFGLSVTGLVHPDRILRNSGARPGDVLVLTKPLGTGALIAAMKKNALLPGELRNAGRLHDRAEQLRRGPARPGRERLHRRDGLRTDRARAGDGPGVGRVSAHQRRHPAPAAAGGRPVRGRLHLRRHPRQRSAHRRRPPLRPGPGRRDDRPAQRPPNQWRSSACGPTRPRWTALLEHLAGAGTLAAAVIGEAAIRAQDGPWLDFRP